MRRDAPGARPRRGTAHHGQRCEGCTRSGMRPLPTFAAGDIDRQHGDLGNAWFNGGWLLMLFQLELPGGLRWVDVGCGTGALSEAILDRCDPTSVDGVEPSAGFVRAALKRLGDRATLHQAAADNMPLRDGSADVVVSGLVLNFIPDLPAAFAEMKRIASGGIVGAHVWDYSGGMDMLRLFWDAADEVDAEGIADEGRRFPICRPDALTTAFTDAGLDHPELVPLDIATPFADFDALWISFTGGQGSGSSYLVSLDAEKQSTPKGEHARSGPNQSRRLNFVDRSRLGDPGLVSRLEPRLFMS
jgi:SAM-dependent methyltransferase